MDERCKIGVFVFLVAGLISLQAKDIIWRESTIRARFSGDMREVFTDFVFTNTSTTPIKFLAIHTSCGCAAAKADKDLFKPGESGVVHVSFVPGDRKGLQEKTIIVETSEPSQEVLTLRVDIPGNFTLQPKSLSWKLSEVAKGKEIEISIASPKETAVVGAQCLSDRFSAVLSEVKKGTLYKLTVTPKVSQGALTDIVRIQVADPVVRSVYVPLSIHD